MWGPATRAAFADELIKMAEQIEGVEVDESPWVTKTKLKRLAVLVPISAAATGLGVAVGRRIGYWLQDPNKSWAALHKLYMEHPRLTKLLISGIPAALTAGAAIQAYAGLAHGQSGYSWLTGRGVADYRRKKREAREAREARRRANLP